MTALESLLARSVKGERAARLPQLRANVADHRRWLAKLSAKGDLLAIAEEQAQLVLALETLVEVLETLHRVAP